MEKNVCRASVVFLFVFLTGLFSGCGTTPVHYPDRTFYKREHPLHYYKFEDVFFKSKDGTKLHGWFIPSYRYGEPVGTVIHFHGVAEDITAHYAAVTWLPMKGFNVFTFDYRGHGNSEGKKDRQGMYEDCIAAIEYLYTRSDVDRDRLLVLGQDMGGAYAISVIAKNRFPGIKAVAVESSFYSYRSMYRSSLENMPLIGIFKWPLSLLVSDRHSPGQVVHEISPIPLLLVHSTSDRVIPYHHSLKLFESAKEPKYLVTTENENHLQTLTRFGSNYLKYRTKLIKFYRIALEKK